MWFYESVFYQLYPFGFCGAPDKNDGIVQNRITKIKDWIPHMQEIGITALYLCPIFESDFHGYDTRDYTKLDCRLGSNDDFAEVCRTLHQSGIRIVLDGVFNHVGRGFWAFRDVQEKKQNSAYQDWFHLQFDHDSHYGDGFWYEGWEGHYNLVKLNLHNPQVVEYLLSCVRGWIEEFDIDGIRLDVAYLLEPAFLQHLHTVCRAIKPDFFLLGEMIHGDYTCVVNEEMLDSCTNYECYKGIHSSLNEQNLFEIAYSLNRQFGPDDWTLYKGLPLFNFLDNHDVTRIASLLKQPQHLSVAFGLLFGMPGIPCIYYGSEWGAEGKKEQGSDTALRPCFAEPIQNELSHWIAMLSKIRREHLALAYGDYHQLYITNQQLVFSRTYQQQTVIVAINCEGVSHTASLPVQDHLVSLLDGKELQCNGQLELTPYSVAFYQKG